MLKKLMQNKILRHSLFSIIFICLAAFSVAACANNGNNGTGSSPATSTPSTSVPFKVTSIDMAVSPKSIAGIACGTPTTVTYTATFHIPANSPGGAIQFTYTANNGRSSPSASVNVGPGETTKTYSFNWSGNLPSDHVYPGLGGVITTSPNIINSPLVKPDGSCVMGAAFQVTSIDMAVSPKSIAGLACGTLTTVTYTATFHIPANSPGGTIQFTYTVNNGRGSSSANVTVAPGETTKTYSFTWSGNLPPDHVYPEQGGVITTSPNAVNSPLVQPDGKCS